MTRLSVRAASMQFDVSRPTITKWIKSGKISAEKRPESEGGGWIMDSSELIRLGVQSRSSVSGGADSAAPEEGDSINRFLQPDVSTLLQKVSDAEKRAVEAEAAVKVAEAHRQAAERIAAQQEALIEAYQRILPEPKKETAEEQPRRRWWPWG